MANSDLTTPKLVIPERFNKNARDVRALGTQAYTGTRLIEYMCARLGVRDLGQLDVLDFGCGCRFADAIVNNSLPVKSYTGVDLDQEMIEFLSGNINDPRLCFYHWNARNPHYNQTGFPMTAATPLPTRKRRFDLVCMFSVITHQLPPDAEALFRIFRQYIRPQGRLFFSVNLQEMDDPYREMMPEQPAGFSAYSWDFLCDLLDRSRWRILSKEGKEPRGGIPIQDSLVCAPTSWTRGLPTRIARWAHGVRL